MNRTSILWITGIGFFILMLLYLFVWSGILFQVGDSNVTGQRVFHSQTHNIQIAVPPGWDLLRIPNEYLNYPEAEAQMVSQNRFAFCIWIPEQVEEVTDISLDSFEALVVNKILQEPDSQILDKQQVNSSWSERSRILYSKVVNAQTMQYLVQLDVKENMTFRTICWTTQDRFDSFSASFYSICDSVKPHPESKGRE